MKMKDVYNIIDFGVETAFYRVHFEWHEGRTLRSDYFPDRDERPFMFETLAWQYAKKFADRMKGKVVNVYVIGNDWCPIETGVDWHDRIIFNRYPERKIDMSHMGKMRL